MTAIHSIEELQTLCQEVGFKLSREGGKIILTDDFGHKLVYPDDEHGVTAAYGELYTIAMNDIDDAPIDNRLGHGYTCTCGFCHAPMLSSADWRAVSVPSPDDYMD
jgi:hypothetical protein